MEVLGWPKASKFGLSAQGPTDEIIEHPSLRTQRDFGPHD